MNKKLTNEIVDTRILDRSIKRLDDYINNKTPIRFQCLISTCNYIWPTAPTDLINKGHGCPQCAGELKLTNEIIDERIKGRPIKRLDAYQGNKVKIRFQCLVSTCNYIWPTRPSVIYLDGSGCPKCKKCAKLTNEILDKRIKDRPFKRIEDCKTVNQPIRFQCNKCLTIWQATP